MARYRTLITEVDAFRWTGGPDQTEDPEWIVQAIKQDRVWFDRGLTVTMMIQNPVGVLHAFPGDWIIREPSGEIFPCKPLRFARNYEEVK